MRTINLIAHCISCSNLEDEQLKKFNNCESAVYKSNTRREEEDDLTKFVKKIHLNNYDQYDHFFWNFSIPQISKEFDLLRIDNKSILNIELKHFATTEKVKKQLLRNKYYLQSVDKELFLFCYTIDDEELYYLDNDNLIKCDNFEMLINIIDGQTSFIDLNIEELFTPNQYLISPFNKTREFIMNEYFLNSQQENIKSSIMKKINESSAYDIITVMGSAGSGKSLLIYDIAKELSNEKKVAIIHCGQLNDGHNCLIKDYDWNIHDIKHFDKVNYDKIDVLIIDEGQRIRSIQLEFILNKIKCLKISCIFSYDPAQVLSNKEMNSQSLKLIENDKTASYEISGKIRSNIEIISFIDNLFNLKHRYPKVSYDNIYVHRFKDYNSSRKYIRYLINKGWIFINYTPSTIYSEDFECLRDLQYGIPHTVIGQEFDKIIVVLDNKFYYHDNLLKSSGWKSDKNGERMLYQSLTRAKMELCLIVIDNDEVFNHCINILNNI